MSKGIKQLSLSNYIPFFDCSRIRRRYQMLQGWFATHLKTCTASHHKAAKLNKFPVDRIFISWKLNIMEMDIIRIYVYITTLNWLFSSIFNYLNASRLLTWWLLISGLIFMKGLTLVLAQQLCKKLSAKLVNSRWLSPSKNYLTWLQIGHWDL